MATAEISIAPGGTPQFVGRIRELDWLRELLAAAARGEARLGLVVGEPGVGKTALVREFLAEADAGGWQTVWGRCSEDAVTPHQPFAQGLLPQLRKAGILTGHDSDGLGTLQGESLASASWLAEQTVALAARRPLVFVIDDFQFGEPETLTLIREYVRNLSEVARREPLRVLILVTHHPALPGDRFGPFLDRLQVEPISSSLDLVGLSDLEAHELIRQATSASCDPQLLGALLEATHGNPFFLIQVLRHLERGNQLVRDGAHVTTKSRQFDLHLPASAASSITQRLELGDNEVVRPIQTAALLGDEFHLDDLAPFHSQLELDAAIDHGVSAGLLVETAGGFAFSHGIIRTAIVESIGPMRRRKAHAEIADSLLERYGDAPEHSLEIASHVAAAGKWRDDAQAGAVFERAGDFAMDSFLWGAGLRNYEAAFALPGYRDSLEPLKLGRVYAKMARANNVNGGRDRGRELYRMAWQQSRDAGDLQGWGLALLGWWRTFTNAGESLPEDGAYEEFWQAAGEGVLEVRAQLLMKRAEALWLARDPGDEEAGEQALELSRRSLDPETRANTAVIMGLIYNGRLRPTEASEQFNEAARHALAIRNPRIKGWAAARASMPMILRGDLAGARAACVDARDLARSGGDIANAPLNLALFHATAVLAGEFELAHALRAEAAMMGSRVPDPADSFLLNSGVAWERLLRGEYQEAADAVAAWEQVGGRSITRTVRLLLAARAGADAAVREELAASPVVVGTSGVDFSNVGSIAAAAELAGELGLGSVAERVFELLEPVVRRGVYFSVTPPVLLPRALALAARVTGRLKEAGEFLDLAESVSRASHAEPEIGLVSLERAKLLVSTSASGREIGAAVAAAAEVFRRLDMVGASSMLREFVESAGIGGKLPALLPTSDDLSAAEFEVLEQFSRDGDVAQIADRLLLNPRTVEGHLARLAKRLGIVSPDAARRYLGSNGKAAKPASGQATRPELAELTKRELEVLGLVSRGLTNQQIADELVISLHTAIRHVANILGKTGAANRTEAARLAGSWGAV